MSDVNIPEQMSIIFSNHFRQHSDCMLKDDQPASFPNRYYKSHAKNDQEYKIMVKINKSISQSDTPFIKINNNEPDTNNMEHKSFLFYTKLYLSVNESVINSMLSNFQKQAEIN
jgi:hypothetical protein